MSVTETLLRLFVPHPGIKLYKLPENKSDTFLSPSAPNTYPPYSPIQENQVLSHLASSAFGTLR